MLYFYDWGTSFVETSQTGAGQRSVYNVLLQEGSRAKWPEPQLFRKITENPVAVCKQSMNWSAADKVVSRSEVGALRFPWMLDSSSDY